MFGKEYGLDVPYWIVHELSDSKRTAKGAYPVMKWFREKWQMPASILALLYSRTESPLYINDLNERAIQRMLLAYQ